jgi:hypothetical protein
MSIELPPRGAAQWSKRVWRDIPIRTVVDGVAVTGEIVRAVPNDMSVLILTPYSGFGTGLHVPWMMAGLRRFWLTTDDGISKRGLAKAADLLKELYDFARGNASGWGVSIIGPDGEWNPPENR